MYEYYGKRKLVGISGILPPKFRETDSFKIDIKNVVSAAYIEISVVKKQQYWFEDSLGTLPFTKQIPLLLVN